MSNSSKITKSSTGKTIDKLPFVDYSKIQAVELTVTKQWREI